MKIFAAALCCFLLPPSVLACGNDPSEPYRFVYYPEMGRNASFHGKVVTINTSFVDRLIAKPSRELYYANDRELFYLLSVGDAKAQHAGAKLLAFLIKNPRLEEPCGGGKKDEVYGIEELAFVFSRTDFSGLCQVTPTERTSIVSYYKRNRRLAIGPDRPWDLTCK